MKMEEVEAVGIQPVVVGVVTLFSKLTLKAVMLTIMKITASLIVLIAVVSIGIANCNSEELLQA